MTIIFLSDLETHYICCYILAANLFPYFYLFMFLFIVDIYSILKILINTGQQNG